MTTDNTYWHSKHGNTYAVCRQCKQVKAKKRKEYRFTRQDQLQTARMQVLREDISKLQACPKCAGILRWGKDSRLEDAVSCVYCGWRPSAKLEMEL